MTTEDVARICHAANKEYCETLGDHSQKPWDEAEQWQRESAIKGVTFALYNPEAPPSAQHDAWLKDKEADGWKWGNVKDPINRLHPCMMPYEDLPAEQRGKDYLFRAIVRSMVACGMFGVAQSAG